MEGDQRYLLPKPALVRLIDNLPLQEPEKRLILTISELAQDGKTYAPRTREQGQKLIADRVGVVPRHLRRVEQICEQYGCLRVIRRRGRPNVYELNHMVIVDRPPAPPELLERPSQPKRRKEAAGQLILFGDGAAVDRSAESSSPPEAEPEAVVPERGPSRVATWIGLLIAFCRGRGPDVEASASENCGHAAAEVGTSVPKVGTSAPETEDMASEAMSSLRPKCGHGRSATSGSAPKAPQTKDIAPAKCGHSAPKLRTSAPEVRTRDPPTEDIGPKSEDIGPASMDPFQDPSSIPPHLKSSKIHSIRDGGGSLNKLGWGRRVDVRELRAPMALQALFPIAVANGWVRDSEQDRLNFFALAHYVVRQGKRRNPVGMFTAFLDGSYLAKAKYPKPWRERLGPDEDWAREAIKSIDFPSPGRSTGDDEAAEAVRRQKQAEALAAWAESQK